MTDDADDSVVGPSAGDDSVADTSTGDDSVGDTSAGDGSVAVDRRPPADAFATLASDARVQILRALGDSPGDTLSFSTLFDRVPVPDSGNFSYHLDELLGTFVRETDGYELTHAGRQVVGAIHAGTYTADATVDPVDTGWTCQLCGGAMTVAYADETVSLECVDCGGGARLPYPPGCLDQFARDELPAAVARWYHQRVRRILARFCPRCAGRLDGELVRPPGGTVDDPKPSLAAFECLRCGNVARVSGATVATFHPVVEGFLAEHGFDLTARHPSQIWGDLDTCDVTVLAENPLELEARFECAGETVTVELAPDASVRSTERR